MPAVLLAGLLFLYEYQRSQQQLMRDSVATARAMASVVDGNISSVTSALASLATSPFLATNNLGGFHSQARDVLKSLDADNIVLSDLTGTQYVNTLVPYGHPLPQRNSFVRLKRMAQTGKPVVTDLFTGSLLQKPIVVVGVPVHRNNEYLYSLSAGISADRFRNILHRQDLPQQWLGVILDSSGTVVARTRNAGRFIGQKGPADALVHINSSKEGVFETSSLEGVPVMTVFSRSSVSDWTVVIAIPKESLRKDLQRPLFLLILTAVFLLAGGLSIAWRIGRRIAHSISGLRAPALALGAGDPVTLPTLYLKEAEDVGESLVKASETLLHAQYQASHDPLTGLLNRAEFRELVNKQLGICKRSNSQLSILYIDLDGFKSINDQFGHAAGDKLLVAAAQRLVGGVREYDEAARLGGDEFAVLLVNTGAGSATVAEKLLERLSEPYVIDDLTATLSASIGIAIFPYAGSTSSALLHAADKAMYEAKAKGKGQLRVVGDGTEIHNTSLPDH